MRVERTTHQDREMPPQHPELQHRYQPIFLVCCLWSKAMYGYPSIWRAHLATCCSHAKVSSSVYTPPHLCAMRVVASLDRKRRGAESWAKLDRAGEAFSIRRLEGSRWRLRRTWPMGIECYFGTFLERPC